MHRPQPAFLLLLAALASALAAGQSQAQTFTTLGSFNGTDGAYPTTSSLTLIGNTLYGMTRGGGANGDGAVFSIPVSGGTPTTLASFSGTNGADPWGSLTLSANGSTFYGMTQQGGAYGDGAIFSVPVTGGTPTILTSFNGTDGSGPEGSLTLSADGSTLYGMTQYGGTLGEGNIFSIPVTGGTPTTLFSFDTTNGRFPNASLTLSGSTLYGMVAQGGAHGDGLVFSIPVTGGTPTTLASFNGTNGQLPEGDLTLVGSTFYGTTVEGGANGYGVVFSLPMTGGTPTVLGSFTFASGGDPSGDVALVGSTLYGLTFYGASHIDGTLFSLPVSGGTPTALVTFNGTNGGNPQGSLTPSANGSTLYGMTLNGGANNDGTVFALQLVPEPSSVVLLGLGAIALAATALRRHWRKRAA